MAMIVPFLAFCFWFTESKTKSLDVHHESPKHPDMASHRGGLTPTEIGKATVSGVPKNTPGKCCPITQPAERRGVVS